MTDEGDDVQPEFVLLEGPSTHSFGDIPVVGTFAAGLGAALHVIENLLSIGQESDVPVTPVGEAKLSPTLAAIGNFRFKLDRLVSRRVALGSSSHGLLPSLSGETIGHSQE